MYGWNEDEALAMNIHDIVSEDRREETSAFVKKLTAGEIVEPYETQRITKSGKILDVWLTGTVLVDEKGEPYAIATTEREISGRET
jgi:two-component system CheB/CheR fusion protein